MRLATVIPFPSKLRAVERATPIVERRSQSGERRASVDEIVRRRQILELFVEAARSDCGSPSLARRWNAEEREYEHRAFQPHATDAGACVHGNQRRRRPMNLSITMSRDITSILEEGRPRFRGRARVANDTTDETVIHCTEQAWRSSWHERMEDEEHAYDEHAFRIGEPLDLATRA